MITREAAQISITCAHHGRSQRGPAGADEGIDEDLGAADAACIRGDARAGGAVPVTPDAGPATARGR
ncbi:hypothetical protein D6T64_10980 [Cryobacterium melibiosiphilum]|uniref:Uncharacterized protein n=1 Tax=Cryobacterium melibiosiphilum TaxID=995039 RepID=A0A3A5MH08_9MICO|nr:hypothetical protein D6T64_10980 [Cryobacterium melibiosiphilum]